MTGLDFTENRIIAILRGVPAAVGDEVAAALLAGGIRLIEVTLPSEGALDTIGRWRERFGEALRVGAGTVLNVQDAQNAIAAGAEYLICPHTDEALIGFARAAGVPIYPGALTPSEIVRAHSAGASAVKVFPVAAVGGPRYLKDVLAPLQHIPLIAVGGVGAENARAYLEAGAVALGVGGGLVPLELVRAGRFDQLSARARALVAACSTQEPA